MVGRDETSCDCWKPPEHARHSICWPVRDFTLLRSSACLETYSSTFSFYFHSAHKPRNIPYLDSPGPIFRVMPKQASIMGKTELQWVPLLGQFMTLSGAVFVDRGNNAKAVRSLAAAAETMKARESSLILFPEGTRSMRPHHDMLPFKKGAFHLAIQAGAPIVPVVCENYWRLYRKGVFESGTLKVKGSSRISSRSPGNRYAFLVPSSYAVSLFPFEFLICISYLQFYPLYLPLASLLLTSPSSRFAFASKWSLLSAKYPRLPSRPRLHPHNQSPQY